MAEPMTDSHCSVHLWPVPPDTILTALGLQSQPVPIHCLFQTLLETSCSLESLHPVNPWRLHPRLGAHIEVGDTSVNLSPVAIGSSGRRGRGQAAVGDGARVPVGPIDTASLDVDVHGVDAHSLVTLEGLLVSRVRVTGEQAADLIVISNVQDLIFRAWRGERSDVRCGERQGQEARPGRQGWGAVGPSLGRNVPETCSYTQPSPFHTNNVFSPNQTICTSQEPLLNPPQCQALVPASAFEGVSSLPPLS